MNRTDEADLPPGGEQTIIAAKERVFSPRRSQQTCCCSQGFSSGQ
jgi:hypothetical protein